MHPFMCEGVGLSYLYNPPDFADLYILQRFFNYVDGLLNTFIIGWLVFCSFF